VCVFERHTQREREREREREKEREGMVTDTFEKGGSVPCIGKGYDALGQLGQDEPASG